MANKKQVAHTKNKQKHILLLIGIIGLTGFIYSPIFQNTFTYWDDDIYILNNSLIKGLSWEHIKAIFSTPIAGNYHPLTIFSLAINYSIHGTETFGYQLFSLLLHLGNVLLVFYFVQQLFPKKKAIPLLVALLFAIHPLQVESVAWLAARKDTLYNFLFLISINSYIKYKKGNKPILFYLFSLLCFALSLLAKPAAVVLPLVLFLLDYWYKVSFKQAKVYVEKVPFLLLAIGMGLLTIQTQQSEMAIASFDLFSFPQRCLFVSYSFVLYILKLLLPLQLSALYPYPITNVQDSLPLFYYLSPFMLLLILGLIKWLHKRHKVWLFGFLFFLINIILVLQFITVGQAIMADRYTYVPAIGIFLLVAFTYTELAKRLKNKRYLLNILAVAYLTFLGITTWQRCQVWKNGKTLWTDVINQYDKNIAVAYNGLGNYYELQQDLPTALTNYTKAVDMTPSFQLAYISRGDIYRQLGKNELAIQDSEKALALNPKDARPYLNMAGAYVGKKAYEKALVALNKAIQLQPTLVEAYINRGIVYSITERNERALADLNTALKIAPLQADAYLNRAIIYYYKQDFEATIKDINRYLQLEKQPNDRAFHWLKQAQEQLGHY